MTYRRFLLDGVQVDAVPTAGLPLTNMCNYCSLKGTACYDRDDVSCHADSRQDGVEVVFQPVEGMKK
jgi:hypothetical protein